MSNFENTAGLSLPSPERARTFDERLEAYEKELFKDTDLIEETNKGMLQLYKVHSPGKVSIVVVVVVVELWNSF